MITHLRSSISSKTAQAYHDHNLESSLGVILIYQFCLRGMLANIHVCILSAVTTFPS